MPDRVDAIAQAQRRDHPILFSAPMIRALLDGRKTETRRVLKPQPTMHEAGDCTYHGHRGPTDYLMRDIAPRFWTTHRPGDLLWVREMHSLLESFDPDNPSCPDDVPNVWFWADGNPQWGNWTRPKPSIHMPRWASRITLLMREVRVERLREITEEGALAEGTQEPSLRLLGGELAQAAWSERQVFSRLWNHIHVRDGYGWDANPWVTVTRFEAIRGNVDSLEVRRRDGHLRDAPTHE